MSGPIVRKYGFPNFEKIFGERKLEHGVDEPEKPDEAPKVDEATGSRPASGPGDASSSGSTSTDGK
jgi:hypothetical protein